MGARGELVNSAQLCGTMFGLPLTRHRLIETSFEFNAPVHKKCNGVAKRYSVEHGIDYRDMSVTGKSRRKGCIDLWMKLLGVNHYMTASECAESVPPAYSKCVGQQALLAIQGNKEVTITRTTKE